MKKTLLTLVLGICISKEKYLQSILIIALFGIAEHEKEV